MISNPLRFLVLPRDLSAFEASYLKRLNRVAMALLAGHVPAFALIAWVNDTGPLTALTLTLLVLVGPLLAWLGFESPRAVSMTHGVAAMCMGGLLVHFGQGPIQIEMHFYFFALLAMLSVFANPMVIVAAAATVAIHHLVLWLVLPRSVFNYDAPLWVVGVHAGFVVLESVATSFIARSFFDSVIGLEKIVASRTMALDRKNQHMRLVLDNVMQGLATIDPRGVLGSERSAAFDAWLGPVPEGSTVFDLLDARAPAFAAASRLGWEQVSDGFMPLEVTLDQMPRVMTVGDAELSFEYRPLGASEAPEGFLVVVSDVSAERLRARAETDRREGLKLFERILSDRSGLVSFFENASALVSSVTGSAPGADFAIYQRALHTLKGNAGVFGLESVAEICHDLETTVANSGSLPPPAQREALRLRWSRLVSQMDHLLGARRDVIELEPAEHARLERAIRRGLPKETLLRRFHELKLDTTQRRLDGFAEQARQLAGRLDKGVIEVEVEAHGLRVDSAYWAPFWAAFVHALRNAVDHGLEMPRERVAAGKAEVGHLALRTFVDGPSFIVEIEDDGRGIDWQRLESNARIMGLDGVSGHELLFVDGLSTAAEVTGLSGRGVGLGALREETSALGGTLEIRTDRGKGTRLRMTFPERATMPDLYADVPIDEAA
jgi:two-component system, chemotaxis family, sensor kinase CheA